jgi:hypothetical protein
VLKRFEKLISIVILNFNGGKFIEDCVRSVLKSRDRRFEVIVVDNASSDGSYELLLSTFRKGRVRLIRNNVNVGFAEGNNIGYRESVGEVVVFLNADTRVDPNWLADLRTAIAPSDIGAAQSKLISSRDFGIDSLGGWLDYLGYVYSWGAWYSVHPPRFTEPFYAEGAAMAVKRSAVHKVSLDAAPFDPDYFYFYEDSDLCWRLRLNGYGIAVAWNSVVYHHRGYATRGYYPNAVFHSSKNRISMLTKNYCSANLFRWLPLLIVLELLRSVAYFNQPACLIAKVRALSWCLRNLTTISRKRAIVQGKIRRVPDKEITKRLLSPNFATLFRGT